MRLPHRVILFTFFLLRKHAFGCLYLDRFKWGLSQKTRPNMPPLPCVDHQRSITNHDHRHTGPAKISPSEGHTPHCHCGCFVFTGMHRCPEALTGVYKVLVCAIGFRVFGHVWFYFSFFAFCLVSPRVDFRLKSSGFVFLHLFWSVASYKQAMGIDRRLPGLPSRRHFPSYNRT